MEDDEENGITVCNTLTELYQVLRERATKEFDYGIDLPSITYQVDMIDLEKTLEYAEFKDLVKVNLGDTVHVRHRRLDIETEARIIALTYDCIKQKRTSLTIGDFVSNYFDKNSDITSSASQVINTSNNTLFANKIAGVINLLNTSLRAQKSIAQKQDVRAILFEDLDPESPTFGALCIGTQGIQISKERNETNTDWVWGTAINFESIIADYIITGILSDKLGKNSWNLDTGVLTTKDIVVENGTFSGTISGSTITGGNINGTNITGGTINGTNINTDKDVTVGNNLYVGQTNDSYAKYIRLGENTFIYKYNQSFGDWLRIQSQYSTEVRSMVGNLLAGMRTQLSNVNGTIAVAVLQAYNSNVGNEIDVSLTDITSTKTITVNSDKRLKENIEDIDLTGLFDYINVKKFNYKGQNKKTVGVIAQDFIGTPYENIILSKNKDGYYSVDYNVILMAIAQKIKNQEAMKK